MTTRPGPKSPRTEMSAPNSTERKVCWNSRDQLWKCLDDNGDKAECCQKYQREFEANCPAQWVNCRVPTVQTKIPRSCCQGIEVWLLRLSFHPGEVLYKEERLPKIQREDGDRRLHTCWRAQAAFLTLGLRIMWTFKVTDHSVVVSLEFAALLFIDSVCKWYKLLKK